MKSTDYCSAKMNTLPKLREPIFSQLQMRVIGAIVLAFMCLQSYSQSLPFQLPKVLLIKGKPIAPFCFRNFVDESDAKKAVNLKSDECIKKQLPYNDEAFKRGFLGYDIKTKHPSMRLPAIYYRYIGTILTHNTPRYVFEVNWSGGGSGFFSSLITLKIEGDVLSLSKIIDGGDRCTGGIVEASIEQNNIRYKKHATPQMLLNANAGQNRLIPDTTLQDCAICCIGNLLITNEQVTGFEFNGEIPDTDKTDRQQRCFNQFIEKAGAKRKATLNNRQLQKLQNEIIKSCFDF